MRSQFAWWFIYRETRIVCCNFEKHTTGLTEVQGKEIIPVYLLGNIHSPGEYFLPECHLYFLVFYPEGNMMIGSGCIDPSFPVRQFQQIDGAGSKHGICYKTEAISFLSKQ